MDHFDAQQTLAPYSIILQQICDEWDLAERDVKLAEQVNEAIIIPSIKEFRYAGRRVTQALKSIAVGDTEDNIRSLLKDAWFDCHCARHDAIDTATNYIAIVLKEAKSSLGAFAILAAFPDYMKLVKDVTKLRALIATSRLLSDQRDEIYQDIEAKVFPDVVELFNQYSISEEMMKEIASQQLAESAKSTKSLQLGRISIFVGVSIGLVGLVLTIYTLF